MIPIDKKIKEISERRKFTSFWETFDYMKLASYGELEALMISLQLFKGKIWDRVVFAEKVMSDDDYSDNDCNFSYSGSSLRIVSSGSVTTGDCFSNADNMQIRIFIMTKEADEAYLQFYKAYAETRDYAPNETLEKHIKVITTNLTTELGIQVFNDWYNKQD